MDKKELNIQKKLKEKKYNKLLITIILVLLVLDQVTKIIFLKRAVVPIVSDGESTGNGYYIVMSIIIVIMIIRYMQNNNTFIKLGTKIVLSLAVAGAIGNVVDRIWKGYVITFINIGNSINLNLAYIYIIATWIGMAGILTKDSINFLNERKKERQIRNLINENKNEYKIKNESQSDIKKKNSKNKKGGKNDNKENKSK